MSAKTTVISRVALPARTGSDPNAEPQLPQKRNSVGIAAPHLGQVRQRRAALAAEAHHSSYGLYVWMDSTPNVRLNRAR